MDLCRNDAVFGFLNQKTDYKETNWTTASFYCQLKRYVKNMLQLVTSIHKSQSNEINSSGTKMYCYEKLSSKRIANIHKQNPFKISKLSRENFFGHLRLNRNNLQTAVPNMFLTLHELVPAGHRSMLQARVSSLGPKLLHPRPPYAGRGFVQERERFLFPEPQDRLH